MASAIASITARSRPSEKLGTHSTIGRGSAMRGQCRPPPPHGQGGCYSRGVGTRRSEEGFARFERELVQERAAALLRISFTLQGLLERLEALRADIASVSGPGRDARLRLHA